MRHFLHTQFRTCCLVGFSLLLGAGCGQTSGCGRIRAPDAAANPKTAEADKFSPLNAVKDLARGSLDERKCRELVQLLNQHLLQDRSAAMEMDEGKLTSTQRQLFENRFGLTAKEMTDIAANSFSIADAHYLEWCFRLREAAKSLHVEKLPALERAKRALEWVARQVVLQDQGEPLLAPPFVLKRGYGGAEERALVFLDFIRQMGLEGCLVTHPGPKADKQEFWLAGVLIAAGNEKPKLFVFDTRLGLPVPGSEGDGVATLEQIRQQPQLLEQLEAGSDHRYDVTEDQAKKAKALPYCLYSSLAPRMHYLEKLLGKQARVRLFLDAGNMVQQLETAAGAVASWPKPNSADKPDRTPPRSLAVLLPKDDGGQATSEQFDKFRQQFFDRLCDLAAAEAGYRALQVWKTLPSPAQQQLLILARGLSDRFALVPQDRMTRGRLENMMSPLNQIDKVLREFALTAGKEEQDIAIWRTKVEDVYALPENSPQARAERLAQIQALWHDDPLLRMLLTPSAEEEDLAPEVVAQQAPKALGVIVLSTTRETLEKSTWYLLALRWLEEAERGQNELDQLASGKDPKGRASQIAEHRKNSLFWMHKYLESHGLSPSAGNWSTQLQALEERWDIMPKPNLELVLEFVRDIHRGLSLRLLEVDLLWRAESPATARIQAEKLIADVAKLCQEKDNELRQLLDKFETKVKLDKFASTKNENLDKLQQARKTLEPGGSIAWIGHAAALRLKMPKFQPKAK
jgi:hypothetical protein